ncbi:uncharacterized protein Dmoj_GI25723 [Drosophila mojavensis]|uniref:HAT C-terminal dimerisation domain-containing protein n=1 Tax=Drosophila mojavensis TaxID=7230 RepID=A0A0Q9XRQ0_DROMO|nr:uncharacterized protein Dmoj_GI25723 [Drosophila mojavensis]
MLPMVNTLKNQINNVHVDVDADDGDMAVIHAVRKEIIKQLERRFGSIEETHLIAIACLLDPRFKNSPSKACTKAINLLRKFLLSSPNSLSSENESDTSIDSANNLWSDYKKWTHAGKQTKKTRSTMNDDEVGRYLSTHVLPLSIDPLKQWGDMKVVYPKLYNLAQKYLGIPATSVPSERLFSKAGSTITKTRSRLSPKRLEKLLFLGDCAEEEWNI